MPCTWLPTISVELFVFSGLEIHNSSCHRDKSNFTLCSFFGLRGFGCHLKPDLGHDLGIDLLQGYYNLVRMIAVVKQNVNFWDVDWLGAGICPGCGSTFQ
jgi:hypothetical protein